MLGQYRWDVLLRRCPVCNAKVASAGDAYQHGRSCGTKLYETVTRGTEHPPADGALFNPCTARWAEAV